MLEREENKKSWGLLEFFLTYFGIYGLCILYGVVNLKYCNVAALLGIADTDFNEFILAFIFQAVVTVLLIWLFTIVVNRASWSDLGLRSSSCRTYVVYGLLAGAGILVLIMTASALLIRLQPNIPPQDFERILRSVHSPGGFLLMLLMGSVLAPLSEELLFRGMLYPAVRKYLGPMGGAVVAGLIFGISHTDLWRAIPLTIGGALLCYIYEKTGSILVSAAAHGTWNGIMTVIVYLNVVKVI